jgi:hypothetical protein
MLVLIFLSAMFVTVASATPTTQERALAFIENVLPIDSNKWHIELKVDSNASDIQAREHLEMNNISAAENDGVLIYFLGSRVGTTDSIDVIFIIRDSTFFRGAINIEHSPTYMQTYRQIVTPINHDNVTNFLAKYQNWSGLDSTKMIEMLSHINLAENASISSNDISMTIHTSASTDITELSWTFLNESASREFTITFQKDFPIAFRDERQISPSNSPIASTGSPTSNDIGAVTLAVVVIIVAIAVLITLALVVAKKRPDGETQQR